MVGNPKADNEEGNSGGDGISDTIVFFVSLYRLFFVPASDHNLIEKLFPFGSCQSVG